VWKPPNAMPARKPRPACKARERAGPQARRWVQSAACSAGMRGRGRTRAVKHAEHRRRMREQGTHVRAQGCASWCRPAFGEKRRAPVRQDAEPACVRRKRFWVLFAHKKYLAARRAVKALLLRKQRASGFRHAAMHSWRERDRHGNPRCTEPKLSHAFGARATFLCVAKERVAQRKATPMARLPGVLPSRYAAPARGLHTAHPCAVCKRPHVLCGPLRADPRGRRRAIGAPFGGRPWPLASLLMRAS